VHISSSDLSDFQSAKVVNYAKGFIHEVSCYSNLEDASKRDISVSRQLFAHRSIPEIFVQQFKIDNPSGQDQYFTESRIGISNWASATTREKIVEHSDGGQRYNVISGLVPIPSAPVSSSSTDQVLMVALVVPKLDGSIRVKARMTHTQTYISAISYSKPMPAEMAKHQREIVENEAVEVNDI